MVSDGSATPAAGSERTLTPDPNLPPEQRPPTPLRAETTTALLDPPPPATKQQTAVQLWLHRTSIFLFVLISAVAGVLLVILPWTPEWTDNYLLLSYPWLRTLMTTGFIRGLCSGLGLLDIWIGFWEALHYHEHS